MSTRYFWNRYDDEYTLSYSSMGSSQHRFDSSDGLSSNREAWMMTESRSQPRYSSVDGAMSGSAFSYYNNFNEGDYDICYFFCFEDPETNTVRECWGAAGDRINIGYNDSISLWVSVAGNASDLRHYTTKRAADYDDPQGSVSSASSGAYPTDGWRSPYWYEYQGSDTIDPAAVTLPASIMGGDTVTVTVTPSAGKVYGGTVSYTWQYRLDGGTWQSLASGTAATQQLTVPAGTNTVEVQVRANDDLGFTSSTWVSSGAVNVTNNIAPTAPGSITVSAAVAGEPLTVTLTAASDPDGTVAAYVIERWVDSVYGGYWLQVQNSAALTFTETVGSDWTSVQYRAAAVDNEGAQGPYIESEVLTVSTGAVTISGPASGQGEHAQPFDIPLTLGVTPAPSDPAVQFAVLLDGAEAVSASHQSGDQITLHIDPRVMARGAHTITVTASKEAYSTAMAQYTYTVPAWDGSDIEGGLSAPFQDWLGRKLLPKTLAQDCLGPGGKDVATWIAELSQGGGSAATGLKLETGSYRGNGQSGEESPNTLSFSGTPQLVVVQSYAGTGIFVRGVEGLAIRANYYAMAVTLTATWSDNGVSWFGSDAQSQLNYSSTTYRYVALIAPEN